MRTRAAARHNERMHTGTVKAWNDEQGWGVITAADVAGDGP